MSEAGSEIRIGTAGWSIPARDAGKLPSDGSHLQRYARCFDAVEINSSFYRPHQRKTYERWARSTPPGFRFSVKLPKAITHERALVDCEGLLDRFAAEVTGLGDRFGVLLVQLPPKLMLRKVIAGRFLHDLTKRIDAQIVLEPRHASWFTPEVSAWLASRRVARVAADPAPAKTAGKPGGWDRFAYYRCHGSPRIYYSDYPAAALSALQRRLTRAASKGVTSWCIFDNTAAGAALGNALTLQRAIG